jgi:hypothetical protein
MEKHKSSVRYAPEVRERAVRMVLEHAGDHASQWEAMLLTEVLHLLRLSRSREEAV